MIKINEISISLKKNLRCIARNFDTEGSPNEDQADRYVIKTQCMSNNILTVLNIVDNKKVSFV